MCSMLTFRPSGSWYRSSGGAQTTSILSLIHILQLFFEAKPSEEQRRELQSKGFKWAPSQGAWQRQLTKNAI